MGNVTTIFGAIFLCLMAWFLYKTKPVDTKKGTRPLIDAERLDHWEERTQSYYGKDSEERLRRQALGAVAKRMMLVEFRNCAAKSTSIFRKYAPVQVPPFVEMTVRIAGETPKTIKVPLVKILDYQVERPPVIAVKRTKLRLAK